MATYRQAASHEEHLQLITLAHYVVTGQDARRTYKGHKQRRGKMAVSGAGKQYSALHCCFFLTLVILVLISGSYILTHHNRIGIIFQNEVKHRYIAVIICDELLRNVCICLKSLGYQVKRDLEDGDTVDVVWTLNQVPESMMIGNTTMTNHLLPIKELNHKGELLTEGNRLVLPPVFLLPSQHDKFVNYLKTMDHDALWIRRRPIQRDVKISNITDTLRSKGRFLVQEFLSNPLLISNRTFHIGIFCVLTSLSPLRMYIYMEDFQVKFYTYEPFGAKVFGKYVEMGIPVKIWQIPALKKSIDKPGKNRDKDILYAYLEEKGFDTELLTKRIIAATSQVWSRPEKVMAAYVQQFSNSSRFRRSFELLRFDLAIDADLKVSVIEINKDPVTTYTPRSPHTDFLTSMLKSVMIMAGLVSSSWRNETIAKFRDVGTVTHEDVNADSSVCKPCKAADCNTDWECRVCSLCLSDDDRSHIKNAVLENRRQGRGRCLRAMPLSFMSQWAAESWVPGEDALFEAMSDSTQLMALWFHRKCIQDLRWCS